jgi:hypothetical protein
MSALIMLVPNSGIQFWDIDLDMDRLPRLSRNFWEEPLTETAGTDDQMTVALRPLERTQDSDVLIDPLSGLAPSEEEIYGISRNQAVEMHLNQWVPLPYFLVTARGATGEEVYDQGPTNWVRAFLAPHPAPAAGVTHRLTLAFDTGLLNRVAGYPYVAPSRENSERQQEFAFVADSTATSWFQHENWIGFWLEEMLIELRTAQRGGRALRPSDLPHACEHYARYQVFLALLGEAELLPRVRLLDVVSAHPAHLPVAVDLVLDLGNSRSCGILIEEHPGQGLNFSDSYSLGLRDLSLPGRVYDKPFNSRVEFASASFGRPTLSRLSGRPSAFAWSSPLRVGQEAVRLAGSRVGNEGATGLSSPKRYLWDERPMAQGWRFNGRSADGTTVDPPVYGPFMALVSEDGRLLRQRKGLQPAVRARFSRSALFTFMITELVVQAVGQINAAAARAQRRDVDKPRQLRSLLLTVPPGMPVAEQRILRLRAEAGVQLAWDLLNQPMPPPTVRATLDEATATQIVWLHHEVTERLQGNSEALMDMVGRHRPEVDPLPSLRIASIDIGGGTTDLMITSYRTAGGEAIVPKQQFRESFKIAGDDVLERVITGTVLPAVAAKLKQAGVTDPRALLSRALGQDQGGQSEQERHLRRLFVSTVLEPVGYAVLSAYERGDGVAGGELARFTIGSVLGSSLGQAARALSYLNAQAAGAGAQGFQVAEVEVVPDVGKIEAAIGSVLGPVLADLCEVVWTYDCDVLLLSGRPSRLHKVTQIVLARAPVPPHRIIGMHRYRVGESYPFRDASNRIEDPKTTAVVGAALCVQAEGRLKNFMLRTRDLRMVSTARFIGKMDNSGQIRDENVLLANVDLDGPPQQDVEFRTSFQTVTQIGFRQLPIARWTATPLYVMEFANPDSASRMALPLKVLVQRKEIDPDQEQDHAGRETFTVQLVEDSGGSRLRESEVRLRLQTIDDQDGYWRDTGRLAIA